jgi:hypothetical protein
MTNREQQTLRLFNEKVEKLDRLNFTQFFRDNRVGFSVSVKEGEQSVEVRGPPEEAIDAFILTLRFFVQDNEATSIRNIGQMYEDLPISDELKERFRDSRKSLNDFLDAKCNVSLHGDELTNRDVFDVFLYGGLAHATPAKKDRFDRWAEEPVLFAVLQTVFFGVLIELFQFLFWARDHNEHVLNALRASGPRAPISEDQAL